MRYYGPSYKIKCIQNTEGKMAVGKIRKLSEARMRPIRDEVYLQIRKAIIRGDYKPNEKLQEEDLAEQLGTSRTPVREALRKLESEKLVTYYPHRGTVVSEVSDDEIEDLFVVRTLIESLIARRAAVRATPADIGRLISCLEKAESSSEPDEILSSVDAFNEMIFRISGAEQLTSLNRRVREHLQRLLVSNHLEPERREQAAAEHKKIVEALAANDPDLAEKYTKEHMTNAPRKVKD